MSQKDWPPQPGELWVADGEWPTYGFDGLEGQEILSGDVFLVIETLGMLETPGVREYAELNVLFRGQTRLIASERFNGVPDMHKLEEKDDIP
jgi:hypothetical protein